MIRIKEIPSKDYDNLHAKIHDPRVLYFGGKEVGVEWWIVDMCHIKGNSSKMPDSVLFDLFTAEFKHGPKTKRISKAVQIRGNNTNFTLPIDRRNVFWKEFRDIAKFIKWEEYCKIFPVKMIEEVMEI